jgi:peroxin-16
MGDASQLNVEEREEMKRRTLMMLMYLLRSPFYDRYSKEKLLFFLGILAHKVPGVRLIARPLLEYLPVWQQIYFYVWAV